MECSITFEVTISADTSDEVQNLLHELVEAAINMSNSSDSGTVTVYEPQPSGATPSLEATLRELLEEGRTPGEIYKALVEVAPEDSRASDAESDAATALYGSDEIEVDKPTMASRIDEGAWVHAWLWVPTEELEQQQ